MDITELDYIVINHMEPDHSGALSTLKRIKGSPTIIGYARSKAETDLEKPNAFNEGYTGE